MGDRGSEGEIWDLTLQLEGLSLRLSRTRFPNPNPAGPPAPVQSTREESPSARSLASFSVVSGAASEPAPPFSLSGASVPNFEPRSRGLATGSSPLRDSPSTPQESPSIPCRASAPVGVPRRKDKPPSLTRLRP